MKSFYYVSVLLSIRKQNKITIQDINRYGSYNGSDHFDASSYLQRKLGGSGCGSVGGVAASKTKDIPIESSHRPILLQNIKKF